MTVDKLEVGGGGVDELDDGRVGRVSVRGNCCGGRVDELENGRGGSLGGSGRGIKGGEVDELEDGRGGGVCVGDRVVGIATEGGDGEDGAAGNAG